MQSNGAQWPRLHRLPSGTVQLSASQYGDGPNGLLVLQPLAEERKGCIRPLVNLARDLAADPWCTLLFDYAGTGDSPGEFSEVRWLSLLRDAEAALLQCHTWCGSPRVQVLGVRMGARLALELAKHLPDHISGLCLWEPVCDSKTWFTDLKRRSRFRLGDVGQQEEDVDGYVFSPEFVRELQTQSPWTEPPGQPCHILTMNGKAEPSRAMARLAGQLQAPLQCVPMMPFWFETDVVKGESLIPKTREILESQHE